MKLRLLLLLALLASWCWMHPPVLQLWTGRCSYDQLAFLRARGAHVRPTLHGLRIEADRAGVQALADWCAHLQMSRDINSENLANCRTVRTADGTTYRRKFVTVTPDGQSMVRMDSSDYNWVYDPTNPNAEQENEHRGYVPMPNVNEALERANLQRIDEELPRYRQGLEELSRMVDPSHRLALDPLVEEPAALPLPRQCEELDSVSFESLMNSVQAEAGPEP
jgi:hypothetical protein